MPVRRLYLMLVVGENYNELGNGAKAEKTTTDF